ncbi:MAG TPA: DNA polymerase III subunit epsilon [Rhizomicrobium sp.]|nr:DNA polymerase III subunit epsilon [Rhizomicrobium sp.]
MSTTVVNIKTTTGSDYVNCSRDGPFGNQFVIGRDGDRETVIRKHREWFYAPEQAAFRSRVLRECKDQALGCYCAPEPCHCDTYAEFCESTSREVESGEREAARYAAHSHWTPHTEASSGTSRAAGPESRPRVPNDKEPASPIREVMVDTETTGFDPADGDRIIEIGCVEMTDHIPTGETWHRFINPERNVPDGALRVHGITETFLQGMPRFAEIVDEFLAFVGDAKVVAHNAPFDVRFLNAELRRAGRPIIESGRVIDTIDVAKRVVPGARYSLDELCKRFKIDLSGRTKHGAIIDAELTARLYGELTGARQPKMALDTEKRITVDYTENRIAMQRPEPLPSRVSAEELAAHIGFVAKELGADPVWNWSGYRESAAAQ